MKIRFAATAAAMLFFLSSCSSEGEDSGNPYGEDYGGEGEFDGIGEAVPVEPEPVRINVGDGVLSSASDFEVAVLFYKVVGLEPPFQQWALADRRVQNTNEFDRADVLNRVQQELLLASQSVSDIGFVEINTSSNFGEYDMTSQGFRLDIMEPSRYWHWTYDRDKYVLTMENANETDLWRLEPDVARQLIESTRRRRVDLKIKIQIVGAVPQPSGGGTLQGKIVSYEVFSQNGSKVGEMNY